MRVGNNRAILINTNQGVLNMNMQTYTIATRDTIAQQFVPVVGFILMPLREAQALAKEYRAAGYDAVAYNTSVGV
jgi:dihydrodipicolinate synthase/N-acetylneuraminate lyase